VALRTMGRRGSAAAGLDSKVVVGGVATLEADAARVLRVRLVCFSRAGDNSGLLRLTEPVLVRRRVGTDFLFRALLCGSLGASLLFCGVLMVAVEEGTGVTCAGGGACGSTTGEQY